MSREQAKRLHHLRKIDQRALRMAAQGTLQQAIQAIMAVGVPLGRFAACALFGSIYFVPRSFIKFLQTASRLCTYVQPVKKTIFYF